MRGIIGCALCAGAAAMYCESDQASLCWSCDAKVHGANFLVARHTRVLLCRNCQEKTPWKASGARLSPTVSVCERCAAGGTASPAVEEEDDHCEGVGDGRAEEEEEDHGDDVSDTEEDGEDDEDEGENQVVPWSLTSPPPATSSGEESSSTERSGPCLSKRSRENDDFASQQDFTSSSSRWHHLVASSPPPASILSRSGSPTSPSFYSSKKGRRSLLETTPPRSSAEVAAGNHNSPSSDLKIRNGLTHGAKRGIFEILRNCCNHVATSREKLFSLNSKYFKSGGFGCEWTHLFSILGVDYDKNLHLIKRK